MTGARARRFRISSTAIFQAPMVRSVGVIKCHRTCRSLLRSPSTATHGDKRARPPASVNCGRVLPGEGGASFAIDRGRCRPAFARKGKINAARARVELRNIFHDPQNFMFRIIFECSSLLMSHTRALRVTRARGRSFPHVKICTRCVVGQRSSSLSSAGPCFSSSCSPRRQLSDYTRTRRLRRPARAR